MSAISKAEAGSNGVAPEPRRFYGEKHLNDLTTNPFRPARRLQAGSRGQKNSGHGYPL